MSSPSDTSEPAEWVRYKVYATPHDTKEQTEKEDAAGGGRVGDWNYGRGY